MQSVEFKVNKKAKRRCARKAITDRTGGKIGVAIGLALILAGVIGAAVVIAAHFSIHEPPDPTMDAIIIGCSLCGWGLIALLCTFAQQNARVLVRVGEELSLREGQLSYLFTVYNDPAMDGRNEVVVPLERARFHRGRKGKVVFESGVHAWHYDDFGNERPQSFSEMEELEKPFEIYDYWEPSLIETLGLKD